MEPQNEPSDNNPINENSSETPSSLAPTSSTVVDTNTINLLQSTIQNVQASFGSVYSTLAMNLKQSLEMTQTMNSVMEQFLQSSIKLTTKIIQSTDAPSQPTLVLTITNTCQFPISNVTGQISFHPPSTNADQPTSPTVTLTPLTSIRHPLRLPSTPTIVPPLFASSAPSTLPPLTRHTESVRLTPSALAQFNATVTLRFPSPGTGKALGVEHGFGVYLADQLMKHVHPPSDAAPMLQDADKDTERTIMKSYPIGFLRSIMSFNPAFGVEQGMWIELVGEDKGGETVSIICLIRSVDLAGSLAKCEFHEAWSGGATENGLAGRLVRELDVLARVEGEGADGGSG